MSKTGIVTENFMLKSECARRIYHEYAKDMPIIDYHCHLSPEQIASDHRFADAHELFLGGDHYKWRQMRSMGISEEYVTGDADRYEKWLAFARTMPLLIGNPIYHWTALELKRYFDVDAPLNESTAPEIWEHCNRLLASDAFSARSLISRSNVEVICTTDDPADDLAYHKRIAADGFSTRILPTFRPDKLIGIEKDGFIEYLAANRLDSIDRIVSWLSERIDFFHANGCRLSDHAFEYVPYATGDASAALERRLEGKSLTSEEIDSYKTAVLRACAARYTELGWSMQLHIGVMRNNNRRMFESVGADTGFDSINDLAIAERLSRFLDSLEYDGILPKTVLYTLNPKDNYVIGSMIGNFQSAPTVSKLQFGSGWWFNDNRDGMEAQLRALGNLGLLGGFVGMLTDSRSFVSYPRHEYFRRILCNLIGEWVDGGEYPDDPESLETVVRGICYNNAKRYFGF